MSAYYESSSPRVVARINGQLFFVEDVELDLNAHGATSSASITLPIGGNPDFSQAFANVGGTAVTGEIWIGWASGANGSAPSLTGLTRAYYGLVSQYDPKFVGNRVTFELRSLASPLVDQKIQQIATTVTTVEFIQSVCSQFGLKFQSQLGNAPLTVQQVLGAMYIGGSNFSAAIHGMRIWDLILQCAQFDNVDVWEDQGTVYYVAPSLISRLTIDVQYGRDIIADDDALTGSHALMFSKDVQIEVRSFQPRTSQSSATRIVTNADGSISVNSVNKTTTSSPQWGSPVLVTQTIGPNGQTISQKVISGGKFSSGYTSQGKEASAQRYIYYLKNATQAMCNAYAITKWRQISQHEYTLQAHMPLRQDIGLIPLTALLNVSGCAYANFNSTYYPRKLHLAGGSNREFTYQVDMLNHELAQGAV